MSEVSFSSLKWHLRCHRYLVLLCALLSLLFLMPVLGNDPEREADMALLFSIVVICFAFSATRGVLTAVLSLAWIALTWMQFGQPGLFVNLAADILLIALCALTAESALRRALGPGTVASEELCAALAAYLVMGIGWAAAYTMLQDIDPEAFNLSPEDAGEPWHALLYFSFATLTTLGYGDITPQSNLARSWASAEAVFGTVYLAILIAHLVGRFQGFVAASAETPDLQSLSQSDAEHGSITEDRRNENHRRL